MAESPERIYPHELESAEIVAFEDSPAELAIRACIVELKAGDSADETWEWCSKDTPMDRVNRWMYHRVGDEQQTPTWEELMHSRVPE